MTTASTYDFDTVIDRSGTDCFKWDVFGEDVLPMWVADMDFKAPSAVLDALHERVSHGIFGYTGPAPELREIIVQRMQERFNWDIQPEHILFLPGMVLGLNVVTQAVGKAGDGVLMNAPVYGPFHWVPGNRGRFPQAVPLRRVEDSDNTFHYEIDFEAFEAAITPQTSLYYLCNPHNPTGQAFSPDELRQLGEICLKHNVVICSDEIHSDLLLGDTVHTPIATLSPELAQQTITLIAPTKTYNIAGLACSVAIIPNDDLRQKIEHIARFSGYHVDTLAYTAALAGYRDSEDWLHALRGYLTENRDYVLHYLQKNLPMLKTTVPEATYLLWIDASALPLDEYENAHDFFLKRAKVAVNPGTFFGTGYDEYVRLNFAAPRALIEQGLERMKAGILGE